MAGRGPAPKAADERRRSNAPTRGEWADIPMERTGALPVLGRRPGKGAWLVSTKTAWAAWWCDGAATTWGPAELVSVRQLAFLFDELERGATKLASEVRLRLDGLGLTPTGKRNLRLRVQVDAEPDVPVVAGVSDEVARRRSDREARLAAGI